MNSLTIIIIIKKIKKDETFLQLKMELFLKKQHSDGQNKGKQSFGKIVVQLTLN